MEILTFALLLMTMVPLLIAVKRAKDGKKYKAAMVSNIVLFFCCMAGVVIAMPLVGSAQTLDAAAQSGDALATGLGYLSAALATGLSCIGAGIAVASAAASAIGATSENPKMLAKSLIFVALAEGVALYGLVISFSIIGKLG